MSDECESEPNTSEKIKVINCETVDAVFEALDACRRELPSLVFRGVNNADYDLRPSLWRNKGVVYDAKEACYNKLTHGQEVGLKHCIEFISDWVSVHLSKKEFKEKVKGTRLDASELLNASKLLNELAVELGLISQFFQKSNIAGLSLPESNSIESRSTLLDMELYESFKGGMSANLDSSDFELYVDRLLKFDAGIWEEFIKIGLISIIDFKFSPKTLRDFMRCPRLSIFTDGQNESLRSLSILFQQNRPPTASRRADALVGCDP